MGMGFRAPMLFLAAAGCIASAQQLPTLGKATAVDVRVKSIQWHPHGDGLLYFRELDRGNEVGAFLPGQKEGKVLLHLDARDNYEAQWFEASQTAIGIVYHPVDESKETEISIYLLDAKAGSAKRIYLRRFPADQKVNVDVDPSPTLQHAVFRFHDQHGSTHMVLPLGAADLVGSPDLDEAERQRYSGPIWSVDGTATYSNGGSGVGPTRFELTTEGGKLTGNAVLALQSKQEAFSIDQSLSLVLRFKLSPPPVGTTVMELMPSNAVLRPVRFKGEWTSNAPETPFLNDVTQTSPLQLGNSKDASQSLWLTRDQKRPTQGVLVAADASRSWISPENKLVAYITNGALFVREIGKK